MPVRNRGRQAAVPAARARAAGEKGDDGQRIASGGGPGCALFALFYWLAGAVKEAP